MDERADGRSPLTHEQETALEVTLYTFALACVSVGLVVGIGIMKVLGAR